MMCILADSSKDDAATFKIDFSSLYNTLCRIVTIDQATLLLYLLLHRNQRFYKYVMAQPNLQQLVSLDMIAKLSNFVGFELIRKQVV